MANFTYLPTRGSLASWVTGTPVSGAEFWFFESSIVKCPNFTDGGTYAPSSAVIVGGSGLRVSTNFYVSSTGYAGLDGDVDIGNSSSNTLLVTATSQFTSPTTFSGTTTFNATPTFTVTIVGSAIQLSSWLNVAGDTLLSGSTVIGTTTANEVRINATIRAPLTLGTGGYLKKRRARLTSGATQYATLQYTDHVTLKVPCTLELGSYGDTGAEMHVSNLSTGSVAVTNDSAAPLITLAAKAWCVLTRETGLGDGWEVTKYGTVP